MKVIVALLCMACTAASLVAGPNEIIKQRAKDLRNENNARQGVTPTPPPPAAPAAPRPVMAPVNPATTAAEQSLYRFQKGLASIKQESTLDAALKQKLTADLTGAAQGNKPLAGTIERFIASVHKAFAGKPLSAAATAKLVRDLDAILNPTKYPQAKMEAIHEDIRSIFQSGGATVAEAADISTTARLMAAEVRK